MGCRRSHKSHEAQPPLHEISASEWRRFYRVITGNGRRTLTRFITAEQIRLLRDETVRSTWSSPKLSASRSGSTGRPSDHLTNGEDQPEWTPSSWRRSPISWRTPSSLISRPKSKQNRQFPSLLPNPRGNWQSEGSGPAARRLEPRIRRRSLQQSERSDPSSYLSEHNRGGLDQPSSPPGCANSISRPGRERPRYPPKLAGPRPPRGKGFGE